MMSALEAWARAHGFTRMELGVMCHNARACGFEVEGVKRSTMRVDGAYVDEYMMAKLIEEVA